MGAWGKWIVAAAAPLLLTGCLWGPGKFNSILALNKNGTFVLDYKGEIMMQLPEDKGVTTELWSDKMARCYQDGRAELIPYTMEIGGKATDGGDDTNTRQCTSTEIATLRRDYEKQAADRAEAKRTENEQMGKLFGLPGSDDESNRAFAAKLMKYQGWRSVAYKGKGVFDVDYHFEGRTSQDFVFPLMPDSDMVIPFVAIRRRTDGTMLVTAPAFTGGSGPFSARAQMMGLPDKSGDGPRSRAEGRFTIVTDGEILTNNSEDGPVAHPSGRQVHWDVGPASAKVPEMLVRL